MFKTNDGLPAITQLEHVSIKSRDHTHEITGTYLREVLATTLLLSDPESMRKHGEGLLHPTDETETTQSDESSFSTPEVDPVIDDADHEKEVIDTEESDFDSLFDPIPRRDADPLLARDFWF